MVSRGTPSSPGKGVPHPVLDTGRYPTQCWMWGRGISSSLDWVPNPVPDGGVPIPVLKGSVPHPVLMGITPTQSLTEDTSHPVLGWGYPPSAGWSTPLIQIWDGVPCPDLGWGYPLLVGWGSPYPPSGPGMEYPHPDLGCHTPIQILDGIPTPHPELGWGTSPYQLDGIPPLPTNVNGQMLLKT